jgi:plastocyanin domain-containing protein
MQDIGKLLKAMLALVLAGAAIWFSRSAFAAEARVARIVEITVSEAGFEPSPIKVKKGEPLKLKVTRKTEQTCATELVIKSAKINVPLPLNKTVEIPFTPDKTGELKYGCAMGMMISGVLLVE